VFIKKPHRPHRPNVETTSRVEPVTPEHEVGTVAHGWHHRRGVTVKSSRTDITYERSSPGALRASLNAWPAIGDSLWRELSNPQQNSK
jgi:hypothetical protein